MVSRDVRAHFADLTSRLATGDSGDVEVLLERNQLELCKRYPSLASWPSDAQLGVHLMGWLLGPGFHLPAFRQAAERLQPDFWACGEGCAVPHRNRPGIVSLNAWSRQLFQNAAVVVELGMAGDRVYFPADLVGMLRAGH